MKIKAQKRKTALNIISPNEFQRSSDDCHPVFSLEFLDGVFSLSECSKDDRANFATSLHKISKRTWRELKQNARHKGGCEKINRTQMKFKIPYFFSTDEDCIVFRFSDMKPMIGFRKDRIYYIVALDRNFTAYDHGS